MRKIEKRMLQAVAGCYDWKESNTQVINNKNGVFVRLYNTIIFAKVGGGTILQRWRFFNRYNGIPFACPWCRVQ